MLHNSDRFAKLPGKLDAYCAPAAATLGLHRAVLYNDREGSLETFRPYAQPGGDWVEEVTRQLQAGRVGAAGGI